ncbi:MAG TPA: heparinase II/III family protein [Gemmatimonadales bacterium]|nr:heparinase II/III family protein [Gemmatimonadales bacterium]
MVTAEELAARAAEVRASSDLRALLAHLRERARPVLARMPIVPEHKALPTTDGGFCPDDGTALEFDPWNSAEHRCPRCGKTWSGERHTWSWARHQHLWLAGRAAHLAMLAGIDGDEGRAAGARARDILNAYAERYWQYPNRDNMLGPGRLFASTYLESIWTCNYVAAATLLRSANQLDDSTTRGVNQVAEEAATLIGDYDEGFSNRQTWNNAALTAVAVWFEDEALAQRAIEGETGLIPHLVRGYGRDGMWYEGENYHLFALRGLLVGTGWARLAGVDVREDERLAARLHAALRAPTLTALPDFTYPARKDSRFGRSLAQPTYLELWEVGLARLWMPDAGDETRELNSWLHALYRAPAAVPEIHDSYLHDAPVARTPQPVSRTALSWWSLLEMLPELPASETPWEPQTVLLESQGLAILRSVDGTRYVSVECGPRGGGHGHPDRLQLTVFADGVYWLPDPGTGSYLTRDLFWYRSTLAHNAPRLDGVSQEFGNASLQCFDDQGAWAWVRGRVAAGIVRMVVRGPEYLVDVTMFSADDEHTLELPWHIAGRGSVESKGHRIDAELPDEFVTRVQRFVPEGQMPIVLSHVQDNTQLTAHLLFEGELLEMEGPGLPGSRERAPFYVVRGRGRNLTFISVIETTRDRPTIRSVQARGDSIEIQMASGLHRHRFGTFEWMVQPEGQPPVSLRGSRSEAPPFVPLVEIDPPTPAAAPAFRVSDSPPLDGTLDGFETSEPLELGLEDQYRRSEDPYPGPDDLSAVAYAGWDEAALYLAVDVRKPDLIVRPRGAPPLKLDNEVDEIHSDGLQVYVAALVRSDVDVGGVEAAGYLIVPDPDGRVVRVRPTSDTRNHNAAANVRGEWRRTDTGYRVTVAIPWPAGVHPHAGARVRFDLIVNEMLPGRVRRVGQLVWSGGGGWVWLRGDRQDPARFGVLELVG